MNFNWVSPKLAVAASQHGAGQFAMQDIACGELLVMFGGHVMTLDEFDRLPSQVQHYAHQINENPDLLFGVMTAEEVSNGEYFNHSCDPNAGFRGTQRLVAMRHISVGKQITFDYATCMTASFGDMECTCGEPNCRKFVSGEDWKIPSLQCRYDGYWMPYIQEKINRLRLPSSSDR